MCFVGRYSWMSIAVLVFSLVQVRCAVSHCSVVLGKRNPSGRGKKYWEFQFSVRHLHIFLWVVSKHWQWKVIFGPLDYLGIAYSECGHLWTDEAIKTYQIYIYLVLQGASFIWFDLFYFLLNSSACEVLADLISAWLGFPNLSLVPVIVLWLEFHNSK